MSISYVLKRTGPVQHFDGMKNFMVFVITDYESSGVELRGGDTVYDDDDKTIRMIKCQIENSIRLGWKPEDIVLATNFDLEYMGVKAYILDEVCDYSQFFHKQYATLELMKKGILDTNIWYHDIDAFQLTEFEFPKFDEEWGTCVYPGGDGHSCQCGVMYLKPTTIDIFEDMVGKMKNKEFGTHDDEVVIRNYVKLNSLYSHRVSVLNTTWNVGMTGFDDRYSLAEKPVKVVHFHPDNKRQWNVMGKGLNDLNVVVVDDELKSILSKYKLIYGDTGE